MTRATRLGLLTVGHDPRERLEVLAEVSGVVKVQPRPSRVRILAKVGMPFVKTVKGTLMARLALLLGHGRQIVISTSMLGVTGRAPEIVSTGQSSRHPQCQRALASRVLRIIAQLSQCFG